MVDHQCFPEASRANDSCSHTFMLGASLLVTRMDPAKNVFEIGTCVVLANPSGNANESDSWTLKQIDLLKTAYK